MREIKFRFWDKEEKQWLVDGGPDDNDECDIYDLAFIKGNNWTYLTRKEARKRVEIMQYTGFKDEDGVEIYEGDIIKCTDGEDKINELNSDTGIGQVEWIEKFGFWNISDIENGLGDIIQSGYVEIIGNIYESPELLHRNKTVKDQYKE